jgi:hypothetical protein
LAWCKVSSLTAAVARSLRNVKYPASKSTILTATEGRTVEGWELSYFLSRALTRNRYADLRSVMDELEDWIGNQG